MFNSDNIKDNNPIVHGPIVQTLLLYFLPIFWGSIIQQSYNVIDAMIIGRYAGKAALGAIDATGGTQRLLINFVIGLAAGGSVLAARYVGAQKKKEIARVIKSILLFSLAAGVLLTLVGIAFAPFFTIAMQVPPDIFDMTVTYSRILFGGCCFLVFYNTCGGILKATGDAKSPFYYLLTASIINIGLDLLFVAHFRMGVVGAGLGTVLAQGISCILVLRKLYQYRQSLGVTVTDHTFDKDIVGEMLRIGFPIAGQSVLYSLSNIFMQTGINGFGTVAIAAWSICGKMDFLIWTLVDTLAIAVTTFVAQNDGAGQPYRIHKTLKTAFYTAGFCVGIISALLYFCGAPIASYFIKDPQVIDLAAAMLQLLSPFYLLYIVSELLTGGLRGLGDTFKPMLITFLGTCSFRIMWVVTVLPQYPLLQTVLYGFPLSWGITSLGMALYYFRTKKQRLTSTEERNISKNEK